MTNWKGRIRLCKTSREIRWETYPDDILSRLSLGDQNVDGIACRFRVPPGLNIGVEHGEQFGGGPLSCLPCRTGEPGKEQGGRGSTFLEGQEQFSDPLEIGLVLCEVVACGHTGGHDENELEK